MKHYSDFSVCLCAFDWQDTLEDFSTLVSDKTFNKLPYADWKYLWGIARSPDLVETEVFWAHDNGCRVEMEMTFHFNDGTTKNYICTNGDNSFGDFLYENYLYGVELDTMHEDEMKYLTYSGTYAKHDWDCATFSINSELNNPINEILDTKADAYTVSSLQDSVDKLVATIAEATPMNEKINTTNNKENNVMNFNFDFGPVNPALVRMSMYGLAVKNKAGTWVSYNSNSDEIVDVDVLNFDGAKFLYRMPVAIKDITVGDVVIHNSAPMFVVSVPKDGKTLTVVDTINGERKDIMLPRSPFGFNFATKVVNFLGGMMTGANADNPFGNMWMLMAMSGEGKDMNDILPFLMMNNATAGMDNNTLMFMALSNTKDGSKDMLPWLLMSQTMNAAPAHECKCGGNCSHTPNKE